MATRVATAYVEISAKVDADDITKQIKDALDKAGTTTARSAGQQMGKDLSTGISEGVTQSAKTVPGTGVKTIPGLDEALRGANVKKVGQQVGKDLATGINEGWGKGGAEGGVGGAIQKDIDKVKPREAGKKIGKEVSAGINESMEDTESPIDIIRKGAKDFGREIVKDLKAGEVKEAFGRVGDVAENATRLINGTTSAVGVHLDSVEDFGIKVAKALDTAGTYGQKIYDSVQKAGTALASIKSGDAAGGIRALSDLARDWNQGGLAGNLDKLGNVADKFATTRDTIKDTTDQLAQFAGLAGARGAGAASLLGRMGAAAGPAALIYLGLETFAPQWKDPWLNLADPNKQVSLSDLARIATPLIGVPEALRQQYFPNLPSLIPERLPWERPKTVEELQAEGKLPKPPPSAEEQQRTAQILLGGGGGPAMPQLPPGPVSAADIMSAAIGPAVPAPKPVVEVAPPGAASATIGHATEAIQTASISVGSATIGGVSVPSFSLPSAAAAQASGTPWWGSKIGSRQGGGAITEDELAKLHAGEHVLTAPDVHAMGGQDAVSDFRAGLGRRGTGPGAEVADQAGQGVGDALDAMRTAGFVPAAAGQQTVAGTSFVAGMLNLGNEAVGGLIDAGAAAAQQAASMAAAAGTFGAGGAAGGAAAGIGIQMAANEAKRAATYGFQLASIGADALIEQMFPFGAPRWIGYDYTKFMPHINVGSIATTSVEKAMAAQQGKTLGPGQQPGGPVAPGQLPGMAGPGAPTPKFGEHTRVPAPEGTPPGLGEPGQVAAGIQAGLGGAAAPAPAAPTVEAPPPPPPPSAPAQSGPGAASSSPFSSLFQEFDEGGWLMPNQPAINTTSRPELVLSPQQLDAARGGWGRGDTYHITAVNAEDVAKQIDTRKRLAMMRYSGRP